MKQKDQALAVDRAKKAREGGLPLLVWAVRCPKDAENINDPEFTRTLAAIEAEGWRLEQMSWAYAPHITPVAVGTFLFRPV
jgi:hypothetical protein